ncbi:unnamed protein product [Rotaria sp. Silwood2]|nr:unnamed protein product [Rotaria sp. Silwood2]
MSYCYDSYVRNRYEQNCPDPGLVETGTNNNWFRSYLFVLNKCLETKIFFYPKLDLYKRVNALKIRNPKLKTLLAVGGWNMKSYAFSTMVHDSEKRRNFVFDTINFLRKHNFDGLEVDWEYPGVRGGQFDDKYYVTLFFEEFQDAAMAQAIITGQPRLILGATVAAEEDIVANGYEIEKITKFSK